MDILNTKIDNVLTEKTLKVRPENIKNGVSIFGINGNYTGNLTDAEYEEANDDLDDILEGTTDMSSIKSLNDNLNITLDNFRNFLSNKINDYSTYTNNAITLYTPDEKCQVYVIHKKSNGKYRVVWGRNFISVLNNTTFGFKYLATKYIQQADANISALFNLIELGDYVGNAVLSYYSNDFDTAVDVINAISSPTGNIAYTKYVSGNNYSTALDSPYLITYTNTNVFDGRSSNLDVLLSQKISTNETIEVKST